ncbi:hypothetical protein Cadr_000014351 [Camelus dromedarius]|uniref:Uncharacterized protein n=1 Tax=Camelus dromedarius TaxID=9838 RepID=A0A5N4DLV7_CAMDR|nr:hypothetical protein Cadr_000014351 [Camelus dromedarius]
MRLPARPGQQNAFQAQKKVVGIGRGREGVILSDGGWGVISGPRTKAGHLSSLVRGGPSIPRPQRRMGGSRPRSGVGRRAARAHSLDCTVSPKCCSDPRPAAFPAQIPARPSSLRQGSNGAVQRGPDLRFSKLKAPPIPGKFERKGSVETLTRRASGSGRARPREEVARGRGCARRAWHAGTTSPRAHCECPTELLDLEVYARPVGEGVFRFAISSSNFVVSTE